MQENKGLAIGGFFMGNIITGNLVQTGAFEVSFSCVLRIYIYMWDCMLGVTPIHMCGFGPHLDSRSTFAMYYSVLQCRSH